MNTQLLTTDALIIELKRRYPLLIVAGSSRRDAYSSFDCLYYQGDCFTLLGLTDILHQDLLVQYKENISPSDDGP